MKYLTTIDDKGPPRVINALNTSNIINLICNEGINKKMNADVRSI